MDKMVAYDYEDDDNDDKEVGHRNLSCFQMSIANEIPK